MGGAIVSFMSDNKIYLLANDNNYIAGYLSVEEALESFESSYNRNHKRGYEASMSACINYIQFQIRIHDVEGREDVQFLLNDGILEKPIKVFNVSSVSGHMRGMLCTGEKALEFHESGISPQLISRDETGMLI